MRCCGSATPQRSLAFLQASKQFPADAAPAATPGQHPQAWTAPGPSDDFCGVPGWWERTATQPGRLPDACGRRADALSGRQPQLTPLRHHADPCACLGGDTGDPASALAPRGDVWA